MRVAQVIVDVPSRAVDRAFDYALDETLVSVDVGSCVLVEFGNRPSVGYVIGLTSSSAHGDLKPVVADLGGPYFSRTAPVIAQWMADYYVAPISECMRLFLPPGATPRAVRREVDGEASWELRRASVGPVDDRWAVLVPGATHVPRASATVQRAILGALEAGPVRVAELAADLGAVSAPLRALINAGAVEVIARRRDRSGAKTLKSAPRHDHLTTGQINALNTIDDAARRGGGVIALDGVTGSGKTEVYLRAIERCLEQGLGAIVLVPEISLTPQTVGRFRSRFSDQVAVLHSRLSQGERYDQWDRVRRGDARVVIGARSALFAPLEKLGLIVIDEEHESSYKQSSAPRYHARDVAREIAARHGATLVLGSATLSMEVRHAVARADVRLVAMPERVAGGVLPSVDVVDMAKQFQGGNRSMFSELLAQSLITVRDAGNKAVLFLNRRGAASFLLCRECGHVPMCESCATSLTYHRVGDRLQCHHCGATRPVPRACPACASPYLREFGAGTQRIETELEALVPGWPVVRMDADTTKGRGAHERLLAQFEQLDSGVLLGTQMIAKGLDYPDVTLVGVLAADITLKLPDFRAAERTYQLLEQVAGRAGRGELPGRVVIQTYWPDHPALRAVASHDSAAFYEAERHERQELGYPPFARLANLLIWSTDSRAAARHAADLCDAIARRMPPDWSLLGPSPCPIARIRGVWRWHGLIKAPHPTQFGELLREALDSVGPLKGVSRSVDIDPMDLM